MAGKAASQILNEFCHKVLGAPLEVVTVVQQDATNPFITTCGCEGVIVARGGFKSKKGSREVAAEAMLRIVAPLLALPASARQYNVEEIGGRAMGAKRTTQKEIEAIEVSTLRLPLSDDRIADSTVGKTPVSVLLETCHMVVGFPPEYSECLHPASTPSAPVYQVRVRTSIRPDLVTCGIDCIKKRAKQKCALEMLRRLYPEVALWGELAESTNSRQRAAHSERSSKRDASRRHTAATHVSVVPSAASAGPSGTLTRREGSDTDASRCGTCRGATSHAESSSSRSTQARGGVMQKMLQATKDKLWGRIAEINNLDGRQTISLSTEPLLSGSASVSSPTPSATCAERIEVAGRLHRVTSPTHAIERTPVCT